jgi:hypothetical protein
MNSIAGWLISRVDVGLMEKRKIHTFAGNRKPVVTLKKATLLLSDCRLVVILTLEYVPKHIFSVSYQHCG